MCSNMYTKISPNTKDTKNARDIYGELYPIIFFVCVKT